MTALPLAFTVIALTFEARDRAYADAEVRAAQLAAIAAESEHQLVASTERLLRSLAKAQETRDASAPECDAFLARVLADEPSLINLGLTDEAGLIECSGIESPPISAADRSWYQAALAARSFAVGDYQIGRITGWASVNTALLVVHPDGSIRGVLFASISTEAFREILGQAALPEAAAATIIDRIGTIVAREPDPEGLAGTAFPDAPVVSAALGGQTEPVELVGLDGVSRVYAFAQIGGPDGTGLRLTVGFSSEELVADARRIAAFGASALVVALAVALGVAFIGGQRLVLRPVAGLLSATRRLEGGDLSARAPELAGGHEVAELSRVFNAMAVALERRTEELEEQVAARTADLASALAEVEDLYENAPVGYHSVDAEGRILRINETELRWLGRRGEEVVGRPLADFITSEARARFLEEWPTFVETGHARDVRLDLVRADGSTMPVRLTATAVRDEDGRMIQSRTILEDITERQQAERWAAELFDSFDAPVTMYEPIADEQGEVVDFRRVYANQRNADVLGLSRSETVGKSLRETARPELLDRFLDLYTRVYRTGIPQHLPDVELFDPSRGRSIILSVDVTKVSGRVAQVSRDVTLERQAQRWTAELFDAFESPVTINEPVRDQAGRIIDFQRVYANPALRAVLGRPEADVLGASVRETTLPEFVELALQSYERVLSTGVSEVWPDQVLTHPATGAAMTMSSTVSRVGDRVALVTRDVTSDRVAEREIREAREEANEANRAKTEFLSRTSHELRTPLNAIIGFAQLLELDDLPPAQRESVAQILSGGRHLLDLINEVLDISAIESRDLTISPEPVSLREVVSDVGQLIAPLASERAVRVSHVGLPEAAYLLADRQRLRQVLLNMLSNAIKYNRRGGTVTVAARPVPGPGGTDHLRLEVTDQGPGIEPALLDRVFAPFDRLGAERTETGGTGLGLSLSKALVEAMGGRIGVDSVPGQGATFWFSLPLTSPPVAAESAPAVAARPPIVTDANVGTRKLLYIEDNPSNFRLVERALERRPHFRLIAAMLGSLGLELAREHRPDLVLLDLHLPDLSGEEVLARLRAEPATADIPIIILSAEASPRVRDRLLALGAADYLAKPIDLREFYRIVDSVAGRSTLTDDA